MIRALLFVLLACAVPRLASAQGVFLQKGTSGYGGDAAISTDGSSLSLSMYAGYSYKGWADGGIGMYRIALDPDDTYGDVVASYGVAPRIAAHPLKQSNTMPLSLAVGTSFGFFTVVDEDYGYESMANGWTFQLDTTAYRLFKLGDHYGVIPGVQLSYSHMQLNMDGDGESTNTFGGMVQGHVAWLNESGYILTVAPWLAIDSNPAVSFGVSVGAFRAKL